MKLSITYKEIENKVKDLAKVSLSLSKESANTLKIKYSSGVVLLPICGNIFDNNGCVFR